MYITLYGRLYYGNNIKSPYVRTVILTLYKFDDVMVD